MLAWYVVGTPFARIPFHYVGCKSPAPYHCLGDEQKVLPAKTKGNRKVQVNSSTIFVRLESLSVWLPMQLLADASSIKCMRLQ